MSILKVAQLGHPVLRRVADPVPAEEIGSPEIQRIVADLLETVDAYDGAGLAAPQVHISKRIVVLTVDDERGMEVWINPVLTPMSEEQIVSYEGCLSVEGLRGAVPRISQVRVEATAPDGQPIRLELEGFPAIVAQHECDHLDGVLYVDLVLPTTLTFLDEYRRFGPWALAQHHRDDDDGDLDDLLTEDLAEPPVPDAAAAPVEDS